MLKGVTIRNKGSYDNKGASIENLKLINFIYGANGCGKTTISNFLSDMNNPEYKDSSIEWENNEPLKTLVYNKKFRDENFGTGKIQGVFTLGKASIDEMKKIDEKRIELSKLKENISQKKRTLENQKKNTDVLTEVFKNDCWSILKKYEKDFKEALAGHIGSKDRFKEKMLSEHKNFKQNKLVYDELLKKSNIILKKTPQKLELILFEDFMNISAIEENEIWKKNIIGKIDLDISKLIKKLQNNDWVNQGQKYLKDDEMKCPFCQNDTITPEFKKQLEEYFDESFENDVKEIKQLKEKYRQESLLVLNTIDNIIKKQAEISHSALNCEKLRTHKIILNSNFSENWEHIEKKISNVSQKLELLSTKQKLELIKELIKGANDNINKHNTIVENYKEEKERLIKEIWQFFVNENLEKIDEYLRKNKGLKKGIKVLDDQILNMNNQIDNLNQEMIEINKNITSVQPTIDEINRSLKKYGFNNFMLSPSKEIENHYVIEREDKTLAHATLSEGEVTLITFLYFLQLAKGGKEEETITENRILVIDDPISSLDSNVLFLVSTLIKDIIKEIKEGKGIVRQLILLTHNVYFHKEVSFIDGRTFNINNTHYWIVRKINKVSSITSYEQKNPIKSSYELLWNEIKEREKNSGITIQNTMRRIIENYFKILGNIGDQELINSFDTFEEKTICKSLLCWVNDGSHCLPDDLFIQSPEDVTERYVDVFKKIFKLTNNEGHYNMMMGITGN